MNDGIGTRWLAGTLLGLPLAAALCTLSILWLPAGWWSGAVAAVLMVLPLWVGIICVCLLFPSNRSAWLWMAGLNLIAFGGLWAARLAGSIPAAPAF